MPPQTGKVFHNDRIYAFHINSRRELIQSTAAEFHAADIIIEGTANDDMPMFIRIGTADLLLIQQGVHLPFIVIGYSKAGESEEKITKYEYNSNGQITKELYHDGTYYYFEYGTNNELLKKVYIWSDGHESFDSYQYDDNGVLVKEMDSYGNSVEYFYDSNYCLIKMVEYDENQIDSVTEYGEYIVFYLFAD